jgi:16S rRNA U516 pseudouridylate synthase RsuA-like enzyme
LHRTKFGGITADDLKPGEYRILKNKEIKDLKAMAMEGLQK